METSYTHLQLSKEKNSIIYVIETHKVSDFVDQLISEGIDITKMFLLKII
jgi:hypothetical protein